MGNRAKRVNNIEGYYNSIVGAVLLAFIACYYLVSSFINLPIVVYPFNVLMVIWVAAILGIQILYAIRIKRSDMHDNGPSFIKNEHFTFSLEMKRKSTHLVGFLLICCYFWLSVPVFTMIQQLIIYFEAINANIWGIVFINVNPAYIPQMVSIFALFCATYLLMIPDLFRVFNFRSTIFKNFTKVMRDKEKNAVGPHICLTVGSLIPMLLIPNYLIAIAGIIIAVFSDAAASLVGRKFGKRKLPFAERTGKSYEGLIGGFIVAFLVPIPILLWGLNIGMTLILALIGAITVSVIDVLTPLVTDNYLNPIFASFAMYGVYLLLIL